MFSSDVYPSVAQNEVTPLTSLGIKSGRQMQKGVTVETLDLDEFGEDPCQKKFSNDVLEEYPCPTQTPSVEPSLSPSSVPSLSMVPSMAPTTETSIGCPDSPNGDEFEIQFYYSVESSIPSTAFMDDLESEMLQAIADNVLACRKTRRQLREVAEQNSAYRPVRRRLEILTIDSAPSDEEIGSTIGVSCSPELDPANTCFIIGGAMTIEHETTDSQEASSDEVRAAIKDSMDNDELIGVPTVEKVTYLGASINDVPVGTTTTTDRGGGVPQAQVTAIQDNQDDDDGGVAILPIAMPVLAIIFILFAYIFLRRRRHDEDEKDEEILDMDGSGEKLSDVVPTSMDDDEFDDEEVERVLENTIVLSDELQGDNFLDEERVSRGLPPIGENNIGENNIGENNAFNAKTNGGSMEDMVVAGNENDLGKGHSGMDVHKCSSSTCELCFNKNKAVIFVSTEGEDENCVEVTSSGTVTSDSTYEERQNYNRRA